MSIDNKIIKVGYCKITIKEQLGQFTKDNMTDNYGQYLPRENKIEIQPNLSDIDEVNTLIHEILHASVWVGSLSSTGQPLERSDDEEFVVNVLVILLIMSTMQKRSTMLVVFFLWQMPDLIRMVVSSSFVLVRLHFSMVDILSSVKLLKA